MAGKEIAAFGWPMEKGATSALFSTHNHRSPGFQPISPTKILCERDILSKSWYGKEQITTTRPRHPEALPTKSLVLPLRLRLPNLPF